MLLQKCECFSSLVSFGDRKCSSLIHFLHTPSLPHCLLTPGLDTALILRTATAEGGRKALHAALGIDLGCFIWGALVAFGLGALLAVSELAYTLLKWCGAGYLCWLGIQLLLRPRQQFNTHPAESDSTSNWSCVGCWEMCLTPKWASSTFRFYPVYPRRAFTRQLDLLLVTIHV